jgi:hypothetical protein
MPTGSKNRIVIAGFLALLMLMPLIALFAADPPSTNLAVSHSHAHDGNTLYGDRLMARQEILRAITDDLARKGISWGRELRADDLAVQTFVPGVTEDYRLRVKNMRVDPYRSNLVFELCAVNPSQFLPFTVTIPIGRELNTRLATVRAAAGIVQARSPITIRMVNPVSPKAPVLVRPGTLATLLMLRPNARITTAVMPLQSGVKGTRILVRDLISASVMTAEVVDQNLLQTSF